MQHARLRERQVKPLARARDRDVGEAPLFLQAVFLHRALLVREQPLFEPGQEHAVELEPLGRVHGHQLQRVLPLRRLVLARLERGVCQERGQRIDRQRLGVSLARLKPGGVLLDVESRGRGDELAQVLDAVRTLALVAVVLQETAFRHHVLDQLGERQIAGRRTHLLDEGTERGKRLRRTPAERARRLPQARALRARRILQLLDRARADAARRKVHHAQQRIVVVGRGNQPQVGKCVLHLGPLEEAQTAVDAIGDAGVEQTVLEYP